jgi:hypothetical protein
MFSPQNLLRSFISAKPIKQQIPQVQIHQIKQVVIPESQLSFIRATLSIFKDSQEKFETIHQIDKTTHLISISEHFMKILKSHALHLCDIDSDECRIQAAHFSGLRTFLF